MARGRWAHALSALVAGLAMLLAAAGCGEFPNRVALPDAARGDAAGPDEREAGGGADASDMEPPVDLSRPSDGPQPPSETCNGIDDDDDGTVDEGTSPMTPCEDGPTQCDTVGELTCRDGALVCDGAPRGAGPERCNAIDDDCDGTTDEGFDVASPCQASDGICRVEGRIACTADGAAACDAEARDDLRRDEACDGFDDDCDGNVDEGEAGDMALTEACVDDREVGECKRGERTCVAAAGSGAATWTPCASVVSAEVADLCDGRDEDCDGTVDNGFAIGQPCDLALKEGSVCGQRGALPAPRTVCVASAALAPRCL
ncbi:MAG: hypothetical protein H6701_12190 [Myxococcales bacterium]|nr:hypothetical protein [Myxococcales bacterium]